MAYAAGMRPGDELAGKVALITGGARNIGRAIGSLRLPSVIIQEGGYHLQNLRRGVRGFLVGFGVGMTPGD